MLLVSSAKRIGFGDDEMDGIHVFHEFLVFGQLKQRNEFGKASRWVNKYFARIETYHIPVRIIKRFVIGKVEYQIEFVETVRAPSLLLVFITYFLVLIRHNKMFWANQHFLKFLILRTIKV